MVKNAQFAYDDNYRPLTEEEKESSKDMWRFLHYVQISVAQVEK